MVLLLMAIVVITFSIWMIVSVPEVKGIGEGKAPDPDAHRGAVVQVYGAKVWGFRGRFAIHTWVATKQENADHYRIYQVIGWKLHRDQSALSISTGMPDKPWFRSPPILLHHRDGPGTEALIEQIHLAALRYPYSREYTMWPGPNSNSFTAWIGFEVPELGLSSTTKAIGKTWMANEYPEIRAGLSRQVSQAG